ncbi:MAG TPA: HEAT repeat domain-containing protein [Candidatus Dormibacteraeota bacterium]|nr:HEAT repeat domain-containing protein [Candidatus Dormibacteraeota bacterium]
MRTAHPVDAIQRARIAVRKVAIRHQLQAVAAGKSEQVPRDSCQPAYEAAEDVEAITKGLLEDSEPVQLLQVAFKNSRVADDLVDQLTAKGVHERASGARLVGALRLNEAVAWLVPLLNARDASVAGAAARALGRIGGVTCANALLTAIQRRGLNRRLVAELARGAPDQFVETALAETQRPGVRPALAIAAGLRRRRTATSALIALLERGSRKERVISCRALGWIGAATAVPVIEDALTDRDWKIRMSAAKALGALRAPSSRRALEDLHADRNPRVRRAGQQALRRLKVGA